MDILLDADGDIDTSDNELHLTEDEGDALRQHLQIRLQLFKNEWFLDPRVGMPYYDKILVKNPDLGSVRAIFRKAILDTPGVQSLDGLTLALDNPARVLSVDFTVTKTEDGTTLDFSKEFILA